MDRVLTDETRSKLKGAYCQNLSTPGPDTEKELTDGLPLDVDVFVFRRIEETIVDAESSSSARTIQNWLSTMRWTVRTMPTEISSRRWPTSARSTPT